MLDSTSASLRSVGPAPALVQTPPVLVPFHPCSPSPGLASAPGLPWRGCWPRPSFLGTRVAVGPVGRPFNLEVRLGFRGSAGRFLPSSEGPSSSVRRGRVCPQLPPGSARCSGRPHPPPDGSRQARSCRPHPGGFSGGKGWRSSPHPDPCSHPHPADVQTPQAHAFTTALTAPPGPRALPSASWALVCRLFLWPRAPCVQFH